MAGGDGSVEGLAQGVMRGACASAAPGRGSSTHVAVGRFTARPDGRDELALLRDTRSVGPTLGIFEFGETDALTANVWIAGGGSALLDGWHDAGDVVLAGDFRGLGHDQLLFINNDGTPPDIGRLAIVDLSDSAPNRLYYEAYGDSALLDGWHDPGDVVLAGDFRGLGHDQLLFINNGHEPSAGRVLLLDFAIPMSWLRIDNDDGAPLDGWRIAEFASAGRLLGGARDTLLLLPD
ncbi:MAG: hypothetical protein LC777_13020 [Actinobacteria bacterium]|nr:hypothetical protein [Actinomycetota bacterium]